MTDITDARL